MIGATLIGPFWVVLAIVPPIVLNLVVRGKARNVRNEFAEQLPENLDVLASALRAGHSLAGAMGVVADEAPEPSKREFTRVVTDEQLGIPLDEALEVTAKRMQNTDIDQVAILALVQREAGGNTAEVLDQVTTNIRARMDVRRLVKVLTAQGKFSSVVVAMVPVGIFLFLMLFNPSHLDPLFQETFGQISGVGGDLHGVPGLLRHPTHRLDRALIMIHFVLILGLFLLAVAVTMVVRALTQPGRPVDRDHRADHRLRLRRLASDHRSVGAETEPPRGARRLHDRDGPLDGAALHAVQGAGLPVAAHRRRHVHDDAGAPARHAVPLRHRGRRSSGSGSAR